MIYSWSLSVPFDTSWEQSARLVGTEEAFGGIEVGGYDKANIFFHK